MYGKKYHLIESDVLGEKIILVDGESNLKNASYVHPGCVAYTHAEVERLAGLPDETLRAVHGIKKGFNGSVSAVGMPPRD